MFTETAFNKNNKAPADETTDECRRYKIFIQLKSEKKLTYCLGKIINQADNKQV